MQKHSTLCLHISSVCFQGNVEKPFVSSQTDVWWAEGNTLSHQADDVLTGQIPALYTYEIIRMYLIY